MPPADVMTVRLPERPYYRCPKHGKIENWTALSFITSNGMQAFCPECIGDVLAEHLEALELVDPQEDSDGG